MNRPHRPLPGAQLPRARKRFGQHFLIDTQALHDIAARVEARPGDVVLEVGPGRGALTAALLETLPSLLAVELDRDLCAYLRQRFGADRLQLIEADVLRLDLPGLLAEAAGQALVVVANLPYNITAPVLFKLRSHAGLVRRAVLTLQKEVAQRLVAPPGSRTYGQLSVLLSQCAHLRMARQIPASSFRPRPRVDSAVVELDFEPNRVPVNDIAAFERVVRAAFGQRRKMLRNALLSLPAPGGDGTLPADRLTELAATAAIDLTQRAEALAPEDFARLADALAALEQAP